MNETLTTAYAHWLEDPEYTEVLVIIPTQKLADEVSFILDRLHGQEDWRVRVKYKGFKVAVIELQNDNQYRRLYGAGRRPRKEPHLEFGNMSRLFLVTIGFESLHPHTLTTIINFRAFGGCYHLSA